MKVIKKGSPMRGVCRTCGTEYLIYPKDLRKRNKVYFGGTKWLDCKYCKENEVKVIVND